MYQTKIKEITNLYDYSRYFEKYKRLESTPCFMCDDEDSSYINAITTIFVLIDSDMNINFQNYEKLYKNKNGKINRHYLAINVKNDGSRQFTILNNNLYLITKYFDEERKCLLANLDDENSKELKEILIKNNSYIELK